MVTILIFLLTFLFALLIVCWVSYFENKNKISAKDSLKILEKDKELSKALDKQIDKEELNKIAKEVFEYYGITPSDIPNKSTIVIKGKKVELTDELLEKILKSIQQYH